MKRKLLSIALAAVLGTSVMPSALADTAYVPMRQTFESKGYTVSWYEKTPDTAFVTIGDYLFAFNDASNTLIASTDDDEGEYWLSDTAYIEDDVTYIPAESVELCDNLCLYFDAIMDASVAEEDELMPLKAIDTSSDSVLVCTWHRYPDTYVTGTDITISYGDVWVFTEDEIYEWGQTNGLADDMVLRMEQLIGLPPENGKTHFTILEVSPDDLYRPSRDNEIDDTQAELEFPDDVDEEYKEWFEEYAASSYTLGGYPWTGLGYTYDWADNGTDYGLSEFILKNGSEAHVVGTYTNEEFFQYITTLSSHS